MTDKEFVLSRFPDAKVCSGDDPRSRIIMRPGQSLSDEFGPFDSWDENAEEKAAWSQARFNIEWEEE